MFAMLIFAFEHCVVGPGGRYGVNGLRYFIVALPEPSI